MAKIIEHIFLIKEDRYLNEDTLNYFKNLRRAILIFDF